MKANYTYEYAVFDRAGNRISGTTRATKREAIKAFLQNKGTWWSWTLARSIYGFYAAKVDIIPFELDGLIKQYASLSN